MERVSNRKGKDPSRCLLERAFCHICCLVFSSCLEPTSTHKHKLKHNKRVSWLGRYCSHGVCVQPVSPSTAAALLPALSLSRQLHPHLSFLSPGTRARTTTRLSKRHPDSATAANWTQAPTASGKASKRTVRQWSLSPWTRDPREHAAEHKGRAGTET